MATPNVAWNVAGALGVHVNGNEWDSIACQLGKGSTGVPIKIVAGAGSTQPFGTTTFFSTGVTAPPSNTCVSDLNGIGRNSVTFGSAGQPLSRTFLVSKADDQIRFVAALDNVAQFGNAQVADAFLSELGNVTSGWGPCRGARHRDRHHQRQGGPRLCGFAHGPTGWFDRSGVQRSRRGLLNARGPE